jgi:hypothetical protein
MMMAPPGFTRTRSADVADKGDANPRSTLQRNNFLAQCRNDQLHPVFSISQSTAPFLPSTPIDAIGRTVIVVGHCGYSTPRTHDPYRQLAPLDNPKNAT